MKNDEMSLLSIGWISRTCMLGNHSISLYVTDMTHSSESNSTQTVGIVGSGLVCNQYK